jgi:ribosomal protein S19
MLIKKNMMFDKKVISAFVAASLSGCAQVHTADFKDITKTNDATTDEIELYKKQSVAEINGGMVFDDFFVKTTPVKVRSKDAIVLPDFLPPTIEVYSGVPMTEREMAQMLYDDHGIKITFSRMIAPEKKESKKEAQKGSETQNVNTMSDGTIDITDLSDINEPQENASTDGAIDPAEIQDMLELFGNAREVDNKNDTRISKVDYNGSLHGFFDWLALDRSLSWKYDDDSDTFVLYDLDTVVFELIDNTDKFTLETTVDTSSDSNAGSSGGATSSKSSTSQKATYEEEAEHWEDLTKMITQMLSSNGEAAFDLKNGRVAITDTKQAIQKIGGVIESINEASGSQVVLNLTYIKISLEETSEIGVNLNAADIVSGAVSGGAKVGGDLSVFQNIFSMSFTRAGVDAMIGSLGRLGSISYRYDSPILTMNNHLTPFQSVEEEHYISEVEKETDEENDKETLTPKKAINKTGITSTWKNRIINDRVIVDGKLSLIENLVMKEKPQMNNIVLPKNALDTHNIKTMLRNGETKVVSIQEINRRVADSSGPLGANSFFLGGEEKTKKRREISVVLVTPYIIK